MIVVYLQEEYDHTEQKGVGLGTSVALMYLGEFTEEMKSNGEDIEAWAMGLYENEEYIDSIAHEIMDRSNYFSNGKDAWENALKLAKDSGYFVVNPSQE